MNRRRGRAISKAAKRRHRRAWLAYVRDAVVPALIAGATDTSWLPL